MTKKLIKEAKRFQELAGIKSLNENETYINTNNPKVEIEKEINLLKDRNVWFNEKALRDNIEKFKNLSIEDLEMMTRNLQHYGSNIHYAAKILISLINHNGDSSELAGIRKLNENTSPSDKAVWMLQNPGNPNDEVQELDYDANEDEFEVLDDGFKKGPIWENGSGLFDDVTAIEQFDDGTWVLKFGNTDGEPLLDGFKEGEDFIFVPKSKLQPLETAYFGFSAEDLEGIHGYLKNNDWELETGTNEWLDLIEIVGEENMPEYIDFIENTLKINTF
jgi:hypothetical protein